MLKQLFQKDPNASIGTIRLLCGTIGAFFIAYLSIMYFVKFLSHTIFENIVIAIILLPIIWSGFALWIIMSLTRFNALLKTFIPLIVLYIFVYILG